MIFVYCFLPILIGLITTSIKGKNWGVKYRRSFINVAGYIVTALFTFSFSKAYNFSDIPKLWKAYKDGINQRLGKM